MIRNTRGASIIEVLVATAIVIVAFTGTLAFVLSVKKDTQRLLSSRSRSVQLQKIVQLLLTDPKLFQVNFDSAETQTCKALKNDDLPLAWDDNNIYPAENCPGCKGRLGYVIQPFPIQSIRGVYLVTIRLTHPKLTTNTNTVCDGEVIANTEQIQMIVSLR